MVNEYLTRFINFDDEEDLEGTDWSNDEEAEGKELGKEDDDKDDDEEEEIKEKTGETGDDEEDEE
ncbi:hypothetical protein KKC00_01605 [Patescibacteria group bacterium]|nr:hypothetical protein [Patescibacteria group bacterium]